MIDLTSIGTIISALTTLLVAVGSILLQRQRRRVLDADEMEDELDVRTRQYQAALRLLRQHEDDRAERGLPAIRRSPELRPGYFQQQQARGRGRRRRYAQDEPADAEQGREAADDPETADESAG